MIVCLEGVDLCGKGTQTRMLAEALSARVLKFPNAETETGQQIYAHLNQKWSASYNSTRLQVEDGAKLDATVFQALQLVNRMEQAEEIRRYKQTSKHLVLDRYWPSGFVFGGADGLDEDWLLRIHRPLPQPDFFILLDIDLKDVIERMKGLARPADRYESDNKVPDRIMRYRQLWTAIPDRRAQWVIVNARGATADVHAAIMQAIR